MDIEGTIKFIVNQQAQFVADIHALQEFQRELGIKMDKLHENVGKLHEIVAHHEDAHIVTYGMIEKLTGTVTDQVERQGWLFEGHKRTEAKLDKLMDKMDRFVEEIRANLTGGDGGEPKRKRPRPNK